MFVFKPTKETYTDPVSAIFKPGIAFGPKYSKGDIVLLHEQLSASKMILNSVVLREALLDSADVIKEILGIEIKDVSKDKAKEKPEEVSVEPKAEEKVEESVVEETPTVIDAEPIPEKKVTKKKSKK